VTTEVLRIVETRGVIVCRIRYYKCMLIYKCQCELYLLVDAINLGFLIFNWGM